MSSKRERILHSAEEAFLQHGYDGTSIDTIVDRVGGSKSTVYAHFRDKRILFAEALAKIRHEIDFSLTRFREVAPDNAREALILLGVELLNALYCRKALHLFRIVVAESQRFPEVAKQYYEEGPSELIRQIAAFLAERSKAEDIILPDPERSAELFFSLLRGDREMRFLLGVDPFPCPADLVAIAENAVDAFMSLSV